LPELTGILSPDTRETTTWGKRLKHRLPRWSQPLESVGQAEQPRRVSGFWRWCSCWAAGGFNSNRC